MNGITDRTHRYTRERGAFGSGQIQCKVANNLAKSRFTDFRTFAVPVFASNIMKLSCHTSMFTS